MVSVICYRKKRGENMKNRLKKVLALVSVGILALGLSLIHI